LWRRRVCWCPSPGAKPPGLEKGRPQLGVGVGGGGEVWGKVCVCGLGLEVRQLL